MYVCIYIYIYSFNNNNNDNTSHVIRGRWAAGALAASSRRAASSQFVVYLVNRCLANCIMLIAICPKQYRFTSLSLGERVK